MLLSLENGKITYRSGEPIRLVLSFTALRGNYLLNTGTNRPMSPVDEISITPETGVDHWLDDYFGGQRFRPDGMPVTNLSATPVRLVLVLNECLRIDGPATYTVKITTNRVMPGPMGAPGPQPPALTTNAVSFTVVPMTDEEERAEMQRLTAARRMPLVINRNDRAVMQEETARERRIDDELSYLSGDVSTQEKLRQFLAARGFLLNIEYSLFMARNRQLVLDTLEKALRDPSVPPNASWFHAVVRLRELIPRPGLTGDVREAYVAELIASLPQRTGQSRSATLGLVLQNLPKDRAQASKIVAGLRETLISGSDHGYPQQVLEDYWDLFRDPRMVSGLEGMLRQGSGEGPRWLALERLMELAPERARPFAVAEIIRPQRIGNFEMDLAILSGLKVAPLPEVDAALLETIQKESGLERPTFQVLAQKGVLAARFASDAIYDPLLALYRAESARWQPEGRAAVLSYLVRVHEREAMPMVERELAAMGPADYQTTAFLKFLSQG